MGFQGALQSNFIELKRRHECSAVNLRHIFRTLFLKNTFGWLLLNSAVLIIFEQRYKSDFHCPNMKHFSSKAYKKDEIQNKDLVILS